MNTPSKPMIRSRLLSRGLTGVLLFVAVTAHGEELQVSSLDLSSMIQDWQTPGINKSVAGNPLRIGGKTYASGIGTHAESTVTITLAGASSRFTAQVGVDDETEGKGTVEFSVIGDGKTLWTSGRIKGNDAATPVNVDLTGIKRVTLLVQDSKDGNGSDHADWADAVIRYQGKAPSIPVEPAVRLTPMPSPKPRINGAKVTGVRPGHPFLYAIAATGERPLSYAAEGLPPGLALDTATGIITGALPIAAEHLVKVTVANKLGKATRDLRIVVGDTLALTPPMGWNSWNCFASEVTEKNVRDAADACIKAGLRDHGWSYINIDDFWMIKNNDGNAYMHGPARDADGKINANLKFTDMKKLTDYIHSLGLKAGIYSSPGPTTCGQCTASYKFEKEDAERFSEWGFDYLKYDWCNYGDVEKGSGREYQMRPYKLMGDILKAQKRDIVFSLCQYGSEKVWEWGADVNGNCWRTTGDIVDTWRSLSQIGFSQAGHEIYSGPGHWNDPDMLIVGRVGWGSAPHPTRLTPNEQYTHISLWSLLAAPLLIGCDMTKLDDFTLGLLTNDEVLAVNQDPLGKGAKRVVKHDDHEVYAKPLEDGAIAVGLFNLSEDEQPVAVRWSDIGLSGPQLVRDLWRQQDLGVKAEEFHAQVPRHGCVLVKVAKAP